MSIKIRLKRIGRKKQPIYRIIVSDSKAQRDGETIEQIGFYNPLKSQVAFKVDFDRIKYWIDCGAKPSETARALLKKQGFFKWYHEAKFGTSSAAPKEEKKKVDEFEHEDKKIVIETITKKSSKEKKKERKKVEKAVEPKETPKAEPEVSKETPAPEVKDAPEQEME